MSSGARGDDVGLLLLVERLGGGIGERHQRHGVGRQVRLHELGRARHADMGVHVDGDALGPRLAARLAMLARRRRLVLVPLGHASLLAKIRRRSAAIWLIRRPHFLTA